MDKVYVFLADGFEEIEGLTVVDILRRAKIETETVSIMGRNRITGSHGIEIQADVLFEEADLEAGTLYVLPGGMPGTRHLEEHHGLAELLRKAEAAGKRIAAICAAPSVLGKLGLLRGKHAACYPGFEQWLEGAEVTEEPVAVSGTVTTSRGMGTAIPFALSLVAQLTDEATADEMKKAIVWECERS